VDKILHHSVRLNCDCQKAFEYFTDNVLLASWLVRPFDGSHADIEPRVGGKYEIFWKKGCLEDDSTFGCRITAIERGKFLSFEWKGPVQFKPFMNNADPLTHVVVMFFANPRESTTDVRLIHTGWRDTSEWEQARLYFQEAWGSAFKHLQKVGELPTTEAVGFLLHRNKLAYPPALDE
jgi:uncharacterized protein YndB with AHSA1/START domain